MKFIVLIFLGILLAGCNANPPVESHISPEQKNLIEKGLTVYHTYCTVCHNHNPRMPGSTGPEIHGSSLELLTTRVLRAEYPAGYKPKRDTTNMAPFEDLKDDIPALHAFLNQ